MPGTADDFDDLLIDGERGAAARFYSHEDFFGLYSHEDVWALRPEGPHRPPPPLLDFGAPQLFFRKCQETAPQG